MELVLRLLVVATVGLLAWAAGRGLTRWFAEASFPDQFEPTDAGLGHDGPSLIEFTTAGCNECQVALPVLTAASKKHGVPLALIDAGDRPDLANKYKVRNTPTILLVDSLGKVRRGWLQTPNVEDLACAMATVV